MTIREDLSCRARFSANASAKTWSYLQMMDQTRGMFAASVLLSQRFKDKLWFQLRTTAAATQTAMIWRHQIKKIIRQVQIPLHGSQKAEAKIRTAKPPLRICAKVDDQNQSTIIWSAPVAGRPA